MRKRVMALGLACAFAMSALTACGGSAPASSAAPAGSEAGSAPAESADEPIVLKMSHTFMANQPMGIALLDVADKVEERSEGRLIIEVYDDNQLPNGLDGIEQCLHGANYINVYDSGCMADLVPDYSALIGPELYDTQDEFIAMMHSDFAESLNAQAEEKGIKVLALDYCFGMRQTGIAKKEVRSLDDMKNLKIRCPKSQMSVAAWQSMGVNGVAMPWSDIYNGLQTGVIDGAESSVADLDASQFGEVLKYVVLDNHYVGNSAVMMSAEVFNNMPEDLQTILQEEITAGAIYNNQLSDEAEIAAREHMESQGVEFVEVDTAPFKEAAKSFYETFPGLSEGVYDKIMADLEEIRAANK